MHDTAIQLIFAEISYFVEICLFLFLFVSYYLATEKQRILHHKVITYMIIIQTFLNINMIYSFIFTNYGRNFIVHAIIGTFIYLEIVYTYLLMQGKIPSKLRVPKNYQPLLMAITSVLWGLAILSGLVSYIVIID